MRGKQQGAHLVEEEEDDDEEEDNEDFLTNLKPRVGSPLDGSGGGFWMAAVSAAAGGTMDSPGMMPQAETGFISSQPSMAEFILPHHLEMGGADPMSPGHGYPPGLVDPQGVQEYPWMKEKKTTRKNSQQGKNLLIRMFNLIWLTVNKFRSKRSIDIDDINVFYA